jgi:hypothetical protein
MKNTKTQNFKNPIEKGKIDTHNTKIHDCSLSWHGILTWLRTGTKMCQS